VRTILSYLKLRPGKYWRQNTGAVSLASKRGNRFVRFGLVGAADITGIKDGKRIEIEVKTAKGKLSDNQKNFRSMIEEQGGVYIVARSVDDVIQEGL
jgi:hypothetical protein